MLYKVSPKFTERHFTWSSVDLNACDIFQIVEFSIMLMNIIALIRVSRCGSGAEFQFNRIPTKQHQRFSRPICNFKASPAFPGRLRVFGKFNPIKYPWSGESLRAERRWRSSSRKNFSYSAELMLRRVIPYGTCARGSVHRLGPDFSSRHESSRNSIGEKFGCHDTSPNRDVKVRRTARVSTTMTPDRIDMRITIARSLLSGT